MKYFLYARKSIDDENRQILSIEAQLAELKEFAATEKLEIAASFQEAKTAKEPGRIKFGEMLARIEAGEADGILAWHPDRLARNSIDGGKIIYLVDKGKIKSLKFPTFWFEDTPQGKFMLSIAFGQSKYYVDNLSENVKRGIRQKLRRGEYPGWAPVGYLNDYKSRTILVDEKKHKLVKNIFETYATGEYPLKTLSEKFYELGLRGNMDKKISPNAMQWILKNPFYYGVFKHKSEIYQGKHEPIISKKLFDEAQHILTSRAKSHKKKMHNYIFTNLMTCGSCGCAITAEKQKGHVYYRCTKKKSACEEKYLREENLAQQLRELYQKISIPDDWADKMIEKLNEEQKNSTQSSVALVNSFKEKIFTIENKLDKLLDSHLDEVISKTDYLKKKEQFINEKISWEEKIAEILGKGNNWLEPLRDFILTSKSAKKAALADDLSEIRAFLKNIGSNFRLKGKKFLWLANFGWDLAARSAAYPSWWAG
ncbi:hypothetical protein COU01_04485 [Candidatus Falkowbacteria bacterium CG10_big_fil_rev_8_21_14_0_10_44_15]|uniref:Recombinase n=1 Tax=Candidatus Falkowbacteria bacterium CG10_big_fil_rev_8_21_14_0_10_44_15 TaxID=1974569 RepID=A0A2H0UYM9_9BACT|nr:MAG: hypothetical protein COU01_04485 [Candidatus Falkowbacteria bacterium CG10_big_fil_rev_8_21_14_0_10_44_15]